MSSQIGGINRLTKSFTAHQAVYLDNLDRQQTLALVDTVALGPLNLAANVPAWKGMVSLGNGRTLLVPNRSATIDFLDDATGVVTAGPVHGQATASFRGGILLPNGLVLLIPERAENFIVVDPVTRLITNIIPHGAGTASTGRGVFRGAVMLFDDMVYTVPETQKRVGRFDYRTMTFALIGAEVPNDSSTTVAPFSEGFVTPKGNMLMMPRGNTRPVVFDPLTLAFTNRAQTGSTAVIMDSAIAHPSGKYFSTRSSGTAPPWAYDFNLDTWETLPVPGFAIEGVHNAGFFTRTGEVAFLPRSGRHVDFWNPTTRVWRRGGAVADTVITNQFYGGGPLSDGRAIILPDAAANARIYTPFSGGRAVPFETQQSRFFNGRA